MGLPPNMLNIIIGLGILIGVIQCFFGYRVFKLVLGLTGFLLGGALAVNIGYAITQEEALVLLAGLLGGFVGAALMVAFYFIGIFVIGAFFGDIIGIVFFAIAESNPEPFVFLILAVIFGIIALILQKTMIIISTAFIGAWGVIMGVFYFTTGAIDPTNLERMFRTGDPRLYAVVFSWLALGMVGAIVQYKAGPTQKPER